MENVLKASNSPHKKASWTTRSIMIDVLIALLPASIVGCVYFGWKALLVLALSVVSAVATEVVYLLACNKSFKQIIKQFDFSSVVTGLLLGLCFNSAVAWYVVVLSAVFAIAVVKMLFGGTGKNVVNPAIAGRVFAFIAFQSIMVGGYVIPNFAENAGVVTGATPLSALGSMENLKLFLGIGVAGCIGETCKAALLLGYIYLVARKVLDWKWPLLTILACGLVTVCMRGFDFTVFLPSILSGGLFLGAIFMATDYVTSPKSLWANVVYFIVLGAVIALLREATNIEVVSFAILLMNLFVPLFNRFIRPRPFGYTKAKKAKEAK